MNTIRIVAAVTLLTAGTLLCMTMAILSSNILVLACWTILAALCAFGAATLAGS